MMYCYVNVISSAITLLNIWYFNYPKYIVVVGIFEMWLAFIFAKIFIILNSIQWFYNFTFVYDTGYSTIEFFFQ